MRDFPLKFSSVANCFVYEGLNSEMLWLHLIIRPLHEKHSVAIREVGFFASDAGIIIEEMDPDSIPLICYFGLLILTVIFTPLLYFMEEKLMTVRMTYGCCGKKRPCNVVQFFTDTNLDVKCDLLIQMIGMNGEGPVGFVSPIGSTKVGRRISHQMYIPGEIGEITKFRIMGFPTCEEGRVSDKDMPSFVLHELSVRNTKRGDFELRPTDGSVTVDCMRPVEISLHSSSSIWILYIKGFAAILRSYLLLSIFFPPNFNLLQRAERLLCLILMCVSGSAFTLLFAGFFSTLFGNNVDRIFSVDELSAFVGAAICLPLPSLLRTLSSVLANGHQGELSVPRMNDATIPGNVQDAIKSFLGLVEIAEASTSTPAVDPSKRLDVIVPSGFVGKCLRKSQSCSSMREAFDLMSVTAKTCITGEGLPVRLSSSCNSLYHGHKDQVSRPRIHAEPRTSGVLFPSGATQSSGKRLVRRYYSDVLHLQLMPVHPRKSAFHVVASPVMIFLIAASSSFIVAQYLLLGEQVVDVTSLILQSFMFTFLVSLTTDLLFALILFRENV